MKNNKIKQRKIRIPWPVVAILVLVFLGVVIQVSFFGGINLAPLFERDASDTRSISPSGGHEVTWSNDGHSTTNSGRWGEEHDYYISWNRDEGHHYIASAEWQDAAHNIPTTNSMMDGDNPWWTYGHTTPYSLTRSHDFTTTNGWQDDDHIQAFSFIFEEEGHDYAVSLEEFYD